MKLNLNFILVVIAVFASMIHINYPNFNFEEYKDEFLLAMLFIIAANFIVRTFMRFKKITMIRTKYDIIIQATNLIIGLTLGILAIKHWANPDSSKWIAIIFSFLGLANGLFYQNSIQLYKSKTKLIIEYKYRNKKALENPNSIDYSKTVLTITNSDKIIEINDIKETETNFKKIKTFFNNNYPELEIITK